MGNKIKYLSTKKLAFNKNLKNKIAEKVSSEEDQEMVFNYFEEKIQSMKSFSLGPYMWVIFDFVDQRILRIGGMVEEMMGKPIEFWYGLSSQTYISEFVYPPHVPYWIAYMDYIFVYILKNPNKSVKSQIYMQLKNKDGIYRNVVIQVIDWKFEEDGKVRYSLCQVTDIAHLEVDYMPHIAILSTEGKETILLKGQPLPLEPDLIHLPEFTNRETQVMRLLALGMTSKLIAEKLGIAKNTVENYRQNLLRKTKSYTSSEVVAYALNNGLL